MRVLILKGTNADGKKREVGKEYDISDKDAFILIGSKKAIEVVNAPAKPEAPAPKAAPKPKGLTTKNGPK